MMMSDDMELVREYATSRSEEAFATLVSRHVDLVYSVSLRRLRDVHLAEEATQTTFIILARKAGSLGPKTILSAWLCRTAQYCAADAQRTLHRRQIREQEGYMQSLLNQPEAENPSWIEIAPLLDIAMTSLSEKDHCAIVLRYFEGKGMKEVGAALGVNQDAAGARVSRAVEKLRRYFTKRGITVSATAITAAISAHSVQAAPATLAKATTSIVLTKSAMVGGSTLSLPKAALVAMKSKPVLATIAATTLVIGAGTYMLAQVQSPPPASQIVAPQQFPNDAFFNAYPKSPFLVHVDPNTRRTPDSAAPIHIKYTGPANPKQHLRAGCTMSCEVTNGSPFMGKRVRVSSWMKTRDVQGWAGTGMVIIDKDNHKHAADFMVDRPIRGTTDWQQVESVTDVPNKPCVIYFGQDLYSPGEIWSDDFQVELVPSSTPITDDGIWHQDAYFNYSKSIDTLTMHDGREAVCLTYTPEEVVPAGSFMWWGRSIRNPDKYRGHTLRMTGWVKTENVTGRLYPAIKVRAANGNVLAEDSALHDDSLKGTRDWTQFSVTCLVPSKTEDIDVGFCFFQNTKLGRSGKVWIDQESIKVEIVK